MKFIEVFDDKKIVQDIYNNDRLKSLIFRNTKYDLISKRTNNI